MIMFQSTGNNFLSQSPDNQEDVSTKSTFVDQFAPANQLVPSNSSEDASIKSENLFALDQETDTTIEPNYNEQNFDPNYNQSIEHLMNLVNKYESPTENYDEQSYSDQTYNRSYPNERYSNNSTYQADQQTYNQAQVYNAFDDRQQSYAMQTKSDGHNKAKNKSITKHDDLCLETVESLKQEFCFTNSSKANIDRSNEPSKSDQFDLASNEVKLDLDNLKFKDNLKVSNSNNLTSARFEINEHLDVKLSNTILPPQQEIEKRIPRPPNAFMIFGQQNRKLLANQFPQYTNKQISKILGDEWRKMKLEEKAHFHSLAEEAHRKHMKKYPGYYYSPLEARQRKADRKKKFFQKVNSRRSYVRTQQSVLPNVTLETEDVHSIQFANFRNATASDAINEIDAQVKILKQQAAEDQKNLKFSSSSVKQSMNNQAGLQQVVGDSISNFQLEHNFNNGNINLKSESQSNHLDRIQNFPSQSNRLACSHGSMSNSNMVRRHLFSNSNFSNDLNHLTDGLQNNASSFFNNSNQSNDAIYHYHHPTIYHVTNKDPNLNSTLNSTIGDIGLANGTNLNANSGLTNVGFNNLNFNNNFANNFCNPTNQRILTSQLLFQHQQIYHHQLAQQHNETNSFPVFLPQIDASNNSSFQPYPVHTPTGQQQYAFERQHE